MQLKGLTFLSLSSSSLMESFWSSAIRSLVAMNLKSLSLDVIFKKIIINEKPFPYTEKAQNHFVFLTQE